MERWKARARRWEFRAAQRRLERRQRTTERVPITARDVEAMLPKAETEPQGENTNDTSEIAA